MMLVNLLPWRERARVARRRAFFGAVFAVFGLVVAASVLTASAVAEQAATERQRGAALARQIAALDARLAEQAAVRREGDEQRTRASALQELLGSRRLLAATLDELAQTLVAGAHYTSIAGRDGWVTATGVAVANANVTELLRELQESAWFSKPALRHVGAVADAAYGANAAAFELSFLAAAPAAPAAGEEVD